jgi:SAM-dependent methyltransferase
VRGEYSVDNATSFGWGPDSTADPHRGSVLRRFVVGPDVVDLGCASGRYVDLLVGDGHRAVGVDAFPQFIREGVSRGRRGQYVGGRLDALPFGDKSFDTSVLFAVLEHIDDVAAVREAIRVTRHRILALVPLADPPELLQNGVVFHHHQDKTHLREYSIEDFRGLFEQQGCRIVAVEVAYPANVRGLLADSLRAPRPLQLLMRAALRVLKFAFRPHHTEVFIVADVPNPSARSAT